MLVVNAILGSIAELALWESTSWSADEARADFAKSTTPRKDLFLGPSSPPNGVGHVD